MSQNNANNGKPDNSQLQGLLNSDENSGNGTKTESSTILNTESSMLSLSLRFIEKVYFSFSIKIM